MKIIPKTCPFLCEIRPKQQRMLRAALLVAYSTVKREKFYYAAIVFM